MPFTIQIALSAVAVAGVLGGYFWWESKRLDKADAADELAAKRAAQVPTGERAARG